MDPITSAIVLGVAGNLATDAIKAAYTSLKEALIAKYGVQNKLIDAVNELESDRESKSRRGVVEEQVEKIQAYKDPELVKLAQELLDKLQEQPGGVPSITQNVSNVKFAATSATGNATISQINDNAPAEDWKK
ncbi:MULTISPECIES: hypothetical protein [unclassified Microcoleus]|uniref:hypothetical protein n=1 Tax=unclassified Microcoleus TaxID=2642155 RepID=UPI0025D36360|nr:MULTISPECIES: hypothetical protein [unclassified Microcoleus]